MKRDKYMGMDVHQATTVVAVHRCRRQERPGNDRTDRRWSVPATNREYQCRFT
jgi:hypothetical protein